MATIDFDDVRLISPGGIYHKVVDPGVTLSGGAEKLTATLPMVIRAEDFYDFLDELWPQPLITADLVTIQPRAYLKNSPWLRAQSFTTGVLQQGLPVDPTGGDPNAPDGTYATLMPITVVFETMQETEEEEPDEGEPETFLDHSISAGAEILQIKPNAINVSNEPAGNEGSQNQPYKPPGPDQSGTGAPNDARPNDNRILGIYKVIPTIEHSLKWKFALNPAWSKIYRRLGTVNQNRITLFNNACPETVLFTGISGQRSYRYFRRRANITPWSLDFKFAQRCIFEGEGNATIYGWNHVYDPAPGKGWVRLTRVDNNQPLYEASDFRLLFRSGS